MILVYQLLHGMLDVDAATLFTFAIYTSTRGHNFKHCKPRASTNVRLNSFSNRVINDWNNLPANVVNAHSLSCFKNLLEKHWTDSQYDCIDNLCFVTRIHRLCLFPVHLTLIAANTKLIYCFVKHQLLKHLDVLDGLIVLH